MMKQKQQLNELAPVVWGTMELLAWVGTAIGATTLSYQYGRLSHEDQMMIETSDGYFEPKMYIGEKFKIEKFKGTEDVYELMYVDTLLKKNPSWGAFSDEYGIYLKIGGSSDFSQSDLRLYLPKKEWFNQFNGKIRKITDHKEGETNSNTFTLCFYLSNPKDSIRVKTINPDGSEYVGPPQNMYDLEKKQYVDDPSRGWAVLNAYKQSGYFKMGGDVFTDIVSTNESKTNKDNLIFEVGAGGEGDTRIAGGTGSREYQTAMNINPETEIKKRKLSDLQEKITQISVRPPSGLIEYEWNTYGQKYANSEFDNWYDGSNGIWIVIGTQILTSIVLAPIAVAWAETAATAAGYNAIKYGIMIGGELVVGGWEAMYLYNRGMKDMAALVFFCCFLPILTESSLIARKIGLPPNYENLVTDIAYKAKNGSITPSDIKKWLNSLPDDIAEQVKQSMTLTAQYFKNNPTTIVQKKILDSMAESIKKMKGVTKNLPLTNEKWFIGDLMSLSKKDIETFFKANKPFVYRAQNFAKILGPELKSGKYGALKMLGLNIFSIAGVFVVCFSVFESNEEFLKDPQGILTPADQGIQYLRKVLPKQSEELSKKVKTLSEEIRINSMSGKFDVAKSKANEYFKILGELAFINDNRSNWGNLREYSKIIEEFIAQSLAKLRGDYYTALQNNNTEEANEAMNTMVSLDERVGKETYTTPFNGRLSSYLVPSDGFYSNVDMKTHKLTPETFEEFIYWFSGYDINGIKPLDTTNSFFVRGRANFNAYFQDKTLRNGGWTKYFSSNNPDILTKTLIDIVNHNKQEPKFAFINFDNLNNKYYIGNYYVLSKIFTDYYDDYLCEKYKICETKENKQVE